MLSEKPSHCPICKGEWRASLSNDRFICDNHNICRLTLIISYPNFFLRKYLEDGTEVYWCNDKPTQIRLPNKGFSEINFDPPYLVTSERLGIFLLFS